MNIRKKTAKSLSDIRGRSKIPNELYRWMIKAEEKYKDKFHKVDIEYREPNLKESKGGSLCAIYYSNEGGKWSLVDMGEVVFTPEEANDFFEGKILSKAEFLIQIIDDQHKIKDMLDKLYKDK